MGRSRRGANGRCDTSAPTGSARFAPSRTTDRAVSAGRVGCLPALPSLCRLPVRRRTARRGLECVVADLVAGGTGCSHRGNRRRRPAGVTSTSCRWPQPWSPWLSQHRSTGRADTSPEACTPASSTGGTSTTPTPTCRPRATAVPVARRLRCPRAWERPLGRAVARGGHAGRHVRPEPGRRRRSPPPISPAGCRTTAVPHRAYCGLALDGPRCAYDCSSARRHIASGGGAVMPSPSSMAGATRSRDGADDHPPVYLARRRVHDQPGPGSRHRRRADPSRTAPRHPVSRTGPRPAAPDCRVAIACAPGRCWWGRSTARRGTGPHRQGNDLRRVATGHGGRRRCRDRPLRRFSFILRLPSGGSGRGTPHDRVRFDLADSWRAPALQLVHAVPDRASGPIARVRGSIHRAFRHLRGPQRDRRCFGWVHLTPDRVHTIAGESRATCDSSAVRRRSPSSVCLRRWPIQSGLAPSRWISRRRLSSELGDKQQATRRRGRWISTTTWQAEMATGGATSRVAANTGTGRCRS